MAVRAGEMPHASPRGGATIEVLKRFIKDSEGRTGVVQLYQAVNRAIWFFIFATVYIIFVTSIPDSLPNIS